MHHSRYFGITACNSLRIFSVIRRRSGAAGVEDWRTLQVFTAPRDRGIPPLPEHGSQQILPSATWNRNRFRSALPHRLHDERSGPNPATARKAASAFLPAEWGTAPLESDRIPASRWG